MRPITVDGQRFRWRFDGNLIVIPEDRGTPQLVVEWGWRDWLEPKGECPEPKVVTPRFVALAIGYALSQGWRPTDVGAPFSLTYHDGHFTPVP